MAECPVADDGTACILTAGHGIGHTDGANKVWVTAEERRGRAAPTEPDRLARIEMILRDHEMHEPDCPVRVAQKHNALGLTYMTARSCTCWLRPATAVCEANTDDGTHEP